MPKKRRILRIRRKREKIPVSPIALTIVLLFVQMLIIWNIYTLLADYQGIFNISWGLISVILALFIVSRDDNSAYKISWIFPMCIFPIFGIMLYLIIKVVPGTKQLSRNLRERIDLSRPYINQDEQTIKDFEKMDKRYANLSRFLYKYENFPIYKNSKLDYYSLGEYAFESIKEEILKAEKYIFIEFFIISKGLMLEELLMLLEKKATEGVEVRFMYDGGNMFNLPDEYDDYLHSKGIDCKIFSPVKAIISSYQNNRDHRKIIVIDGKVGFTGGINIADEYINKKPRFGHWKDCAIKIEGEGVKSLASMFLQMWNIDTPYAVEDYDYYLTDDEHYEEIRGKRAKRNREKFIQDSMKISDNLQDKLLLNQDTVITVKQENSIILEKDIRQIENQEHKYNNYIIPYGDYPVNPNRPAEAIYMHILFYAKDYVDIMTPYLIIDDEISMAMKFASKRGVKVRLLLPGVPDKKIPYMVAQSYFKELIKAGIEIYIYTQGFVHSKIFVSDDIVSTVGTVNLDYRSLYLHFENGVFCYDEKLAKDIKEDFDKTLNVSMKMTIEKYKEIPIIIRILGKLMRIIAPIM